MTSFTYAKNASQLHRKIGEILSTCAPWKGFKTEQEVLVRDLFSSFGSSTERYDWVIKDLFTIIEAHGKQHYSVQSFGRDAGEALMAHEAQKSRDARKEEIARLHNWTYIVIPYTDEKKLTEEYLWNVYQEAKVEEAPKRVDHKPRPRQKPSQEQLDRARAYRRRIYEQQREYKRNRKYKG